MEHPDVLDPDDKALSWVDYLRDIFTADRSDAEKPLPITYSVWLTKHIGSATLTPCPGNYPKNASAVLTLPKSDDRPQEFHQDTLASCQLSVCQIRSFIDGFPVYEAGVRQIRLHPDDTWCLNRNLSEGHLPFPEPKNATERISAVVTHYDDSAEDGSLERQRTYWKSSWMFMGTYPATLNPDAEDETRGLVTVVARMVSRKGEAD